MHYFRGKAVASPADNEVFIIAAKILAECNSKLTR
jgi:hypothetical protein